jgi:hypothetical protein
MPIFVLHVTDLSVSADPSAWAERRLIDIAISYPKTNRAEMTMIKTQARHLDFFGPAAKVRAFAQINPP